jgi:hypothetical protein
MFRCSGGRERTAKDDAQLGEDDQDAFANSRCTWLAPLRSKPPASSRIASLRCSVETRFFTNATREDRPAETPGRHLEMRTGT